MGIIIMEQQTGPSLPIQWLTIKDEATGIRANFPGRPLEMTFDLPFQNTPAKGKIHLYSVPSQKGLLVLSTFSSSEINSGWLQKEQFHAFFEKTLIPYFFFSF